MLKNARVEAMNFVDLIYRRTRALNRSVDEVSNWIIRDYYLLLEIIDGTIRMFAIVMVGLKVTVS